jgi:4-hydroxy-tetrahydrodipicolinate reductase
MKLALVGAAGRMGQAILRLVREDTAIELVGACDAPGSPRVGRDVGEVAQLGTWGVALSSGVEDALLGAEVCIDFSSPRGAAAVARACARARVALVSGTTGLDDEALRAIDEAAAVVPALWAPNTSLGVQVLAELVREAVARLGPGFDLEIVEVHHRRKADAPSGTALRLAEAAREGRAGLAVVPGREGTPGPRKAEELGVFAVRGGDVIGDHTVHLLGDGERIELTHRATSRDLFARGALRAAQFVRGKAPGRYTMRDVIAGSLYFKVCLTLLPTAPTTPTTLTTTTTVLTTMTDPTTLTVLTIITALRAMTGTTAITGAVGTAGAMDTAVGTAGRLGGMGIGGAPRAPGSSIWSRPRCSSPRRISWCGRPPGI